MESSGLPRGHQDFLGSQRIIWGMDAAEAVAGEAARFHASRVFIVSSNSIATGTPIVGSVAKELGSRYAGFFSGCIAHVPRPSVLAAAAAIRSAEADLVVGIGGGSVADTIKVAQVCLAQDVRRIEDMDVLHIRVAADGTRSTPPSKPSPFRQIAVPTTLSAAEFGNLGGSTDPRSGAKHAFTSNDMAAASIILDPAVTVYTPDWLWLSSGVRALDHAIEAICSVDRNPYVQGLAMHAVEMLAENLAAVRKDERDLNARLRCQQATWLASASINRVNFGASHGIGHVLGGLADVPHGYTSCVLLPTVLAWNEEFTREQQGLLERLFGRSGSAAAGVRALVEGLGLPTRIRDLDIDEALLPRAAELAMANMWVRTNPRPITSSADVLEILNAAW